MSPDVGVPLEGAHGAHTLHLEQEDLKQGQNGRPLTCRARKARASSMVESDYSEGANDLETYCRQLGRASPCESGSGHARRLFGRTSFDAISEPYQINPP